MNKIELGKKLRDIRKKKGYTQYTLAEMAGVGNVYLGEIERGLKILVIWKPLGQNWHIILDTCWAMRSCPGSFPGIMQIRS